MGEQEDDEDEEEDEPDEIEQPVKRTKPESSTHVKEPPKKRTKVEKKEPVDNDLTESEDGIKLPNQAQITP
jgi:hypothetical protein